MRARNSISGIFLLLSVGGIAYAWLYADGGRPAEGSSPASPRPAADSGAPPVPVPMSVPTSAPMPMPAATGTPLAARHRASAERPARPPARIHRLHWPPRQTQPEAGPAAADDNPSGAIASRSAEPGREGPASMNGKALPTAIAASVAAPRPPTGSTGKSDFGVAIGVGIYRMPRWIGARDQGSQLMPYLDLTWKDRVELSTTDGLSVDLIGGKTWHGGLVGTLLWGRSSRDTRSLPPGLGTLPNRYQAGAYLEYDPTPALAVGGRWRHDIENTGAAYFDLYADLDLPAIGPVEHDVKLSAQFLNRAAMRQLFGVREDEASRLGSEAYAPGAGWNQAALNYEVFLPTSLHTGFALEAGLARLTGNAARSPLVRSFGSRYQRDAMAAFIYHF